MIFSPVQILLTILAVTLGTMLTRFLPFLLFPNSSKTPKFIRYLGKVLPYAVMGMHLWKKNTLLSIGAGTTLYMVLIQFVFI